MNTHRCDKCNKNITKRSPGLECSRCEKVVHLNTTCSSLSNKQITAIRASENLDWTCPECQRISPKRNSIIIPDEDEDEDVFKESSSNAAPLNVKKLIHDISAEVHKALKKELNDLRESLQFNDEKMDKVLEGIEACKQSVRDLQKKNIDLTNKNKNLELRVGALEQRLEEIEQQNLAKHVEIINVPCLDQENVSTVVEKISGKLNLSKDDVKTAQRLAKKKDTPGAILVELKDEGLQDKWVLATKNRKITALDIFPTVPGITSKPIYIRESLTSYSKKLLWVTKQELGSTHKFIWCKKGKILIRKSEESKLVTLIRNEEDIKKLQV